MAANGRLLCWKAAPMAKPERDMAVSRAAVAPTWAAAPRPAATQNRAVNCGEASGQTSQQTATKTRVNGRPNRTRTSVAPHGPASPMSPRCSALRAT